MEHNIGVGVIVGLAFASSIYVWENKSFTKTQKTILLACIIFVPLQWILIPIILYFNKIDKETSPEGVIEKKEEEVNSNLKQLKEKGILTDEEYNQKVEKLEAERLERDLKNSTEYKQLKSLLDSGVLTKEEFEGKVNGLKYNKLEINSQTNKRHFKDDEGYVKASKSDNSYDIAKILLILTLFILVVLSILSILDKQDNFI